MTTRRCFFTGLTIDLSRNTFVSFSVWPHEAGTEYARRDAYVRFVNDHGPRAAVREEHRNSYAEHVGQGFLFVGDPEC